MNMYNIGVKYVSAIEKSTFLLNFLAPAMNIDCVVSQHYNIGSSLVDTVTLNCKYNLNKDDYLKQPITELKHLGQSSHKLCWACILQLSKQWFYLCFLPICFLFFFVAILPKWQE